MKVKSKKGKKKKGEPKKKKFNPKSYAKLWDYKLRAMEDSRSMLLNQNSELIKENTTLKQKIDSANEDMLEIVGYFKDQQVQQSANIKEVEEKSAENVISFQHKVDKIRQDNQEELERIRERAEDSERELEHVRAELNSLNEFYNMREKIVQEMETIKDSAEVALQEHRKDVEKLKKDHQKELAKIKEYMLREIERIKMNALDEALRGIQDAEKFVYDENLRLSDLAVKNNAVITKLRNRLDKRGENILVLTNENETLSKDVKLLAVRKFMDREKCDKLANRINELEQVTKTIKKDGGMASDHLNQRWSSQCKEYQDENNKLSLILDELLKENKKLKKHASRLVSNRTDVEKFFLESLDYIKEQTRSSKQVRLPPVRLTKGNEMRVVDKFRIEDLSWEQREWILRFIFAKINITETK